MAVVMSPIVAPGIVISRIPVSTVIIAEVRCLIVISIRSIVGTVIIEPEPAVAITKTMATVASETVAPEMVASKMMTTAVPVVAPEMVASIMMATAVAPRDQLNRHAIFRLEPVKIITGRC